MKNWFKHNRIALLMIVIVAAATNWAVRRFETPGRLDVVTAQAMDMSAMRPPAGAAPVALASMRPGTLAAAVTYTGSVLAYNEQDISPRIAGTVVDLPVYPGDSVSAGQLLVRLDSAEVTARVDAARAQALQAEMTESTAGLNHHLHHYAALDQARSQVEVAKQSVVDARAQWQASKDAVAEARAGVQSASASTDYWNLQLPREKQLLDAGAVSRQDYESEQSQADAARAGLDSAQAKLREAEASRQSGAAKLAEAQRQVKAAGAGERMAMADLDVAASQEREAAAGAQAARASAREAAVVQSYTRIESPVGGVVIDRPIAPGTLVQPGTTILKIAEIDRVRCQANVAVSDIDGIVPGNRVEITSADGARSIEAKVTSVFPAASDQTRTAVVEAVVDNPGHLWLPGASVSMKIEKTRPSTPSTGFVVPVSSIISEGGQSYVWVARRGDPNAVRYRAACGFTYSAAEAKKDHYICPMDHKPLVPIKPSASSRSTEGPLTASRIGVVVGATDGTSTEIQSPNLVPWDRVVTHGMAGLSEGARVIETAWGVDGPISLPTAAQADEGMTVYKCETCGMTYSEADAKKYNFVDPMDGGRLVAVKEGK